MPQYTVKNLRFLLELIKQYGLEFLDMRDNFLKDKRAKYSNAHLSQNWSQYYELSFPEFLQKMTADVGVFSLIGEFTSLDHLEEKMQRIGDQLDQKADQKYLETPEKQRPDFLLNMVGLSTAMFAAMTSLMVYGVYINDLIKLARETDNPKVADDALMKAIRIDRTAMCCPTAATRIAKAVIFNDQLFFNKLRNALTGKLGVRESKNYQKMRFVLNTLHELRALDQSDADLEQLFVKELKLYSDTQGSAQKNISEFTRKFKKQKSTI